MTTETKNIYDVLPEMITEVGKDKDLQRELEEYLVEHHEMPRGTFIEFLASVDRAENTDEEIIPVYLNAVFAVTKDEKYNPSDYIAAKDVKKISKFRFERDEELTLPYTIEGVLKVTDEDFLTALSYQEIAKLKNSGILEYNFQTQRLSKKKVSKRTGKITEKEDVRTKSVDNIVRLMKEGKYDPSTLLFNVLMDGKSSIDYEDGSLTINEESTLNLIDGMHRVMAIVRLLEELPNFEGKMNIDIKHYPIQKAQKLLAITNTVNKFDKTLTEYYGGEQIGQLITKDLMKMPELHNRIEIKTALNKGITITNFSIVSKAIEDIFAPKDSKDKYDITDVLRRFFEYFMTAYSNQLIKDRANYLKSSWLPHHNLFVFHIVVAKKLFDKYGKEFPVDEIVRIYDSIDFNKETSKITEIMGGQGKVNSNKVKADLRKFAEEAVDKLLK